MGKKLLLSLLLLILILSVSPNVSPTVSATEYPSIHVDPATTEDPALTPGTTYTVAIKTDYGTYGESDIWGWGLTLEYDPDVLHVGLNTTDTWTGDGTTKTFITNQTPVAWHSEKVYVNQTLMTRNVNYTISYAKGKIIFMVAPADGVVVKVTYMGGGVENGNLITKEKDESATFIPPSVINNTGGFISATCAYFFYVWPPPETTSGPGTLAYITFTVVGVGVANITLGSESQLQGWNSEGKVPYVIIDAETMPDHIGHGYFSNVLNIHDVAVTSLMVPATAVLGDIIPIDVKIANEGNFTETLNVTVYANTTLIGEATVGLMSGETKTLSFDWDTAGSTAGTYIINATATVDEDDDPADNKATEIIELVAIHDVALTILEVPAQVFLGDIVSINVTVANEGHFNEDIALKVSYKTEPPSPFGGVLGTVNFTLSSGSSETFSFTWDTTGLSTQYTYVINATATIAVDEHPDDNIKTAEITLELGHDVRVVSPLTAPNTAFVGELVAIGATVENVGGFTETFTLTAHYDDTIIETQTVTNLAPGVAVTLEFEWNTADILPASYVLRIEATLDVDADPTNNKGYAIVHVKSPLGEITGVVKDASTGNPIESANVTANGYSAVTNATGHYNIPSVPAGTYTVTASANGYEGSSKTDVTVVAEKTTRVNFTLTPLPGTINGTVRDSATGDPIAGATVTVNGLSTTTDSSGVYTIPNLPAGTYNITVSADGYQTASETGITVERGETTTVDFELNPVQQINFLLYGGVAVAIIAMAGIAIYLLKVRKPS